MRYLVIAAVALLVMGGCSSASNKGDESANYKTQTKVGDNPQEDMIMDQEFDLLIAPEYDYETEVPYAEQIKNAPAKKTQAKTSKKPAAIKK